MDAVRSWRPHQALEDMDKIRCVFCNFPTTAPWHGKVFECEGECYTTYTLVQPDDELDRVKWRLCEIFFLDEQFNQRVSPEELDKHCEFRTLPLDGGDEYILFAREHRATDVEIEKLKNAAEQEIIVGVDSMERLDGALDRFRMDLKNNADPAKLLNDIKVVEKLVQIIRQKIELID